MLMVRISNDAKIYSSMQTCSMISFAKWEQQRSDPFPRSLNNLCPYVCLKNEMIILT